MTTGLNDQRGGVLRLKDLLIGLTTFSDQDDMPVAGLVLDSRESVCGDVFVALAGAKQHGLAHVEQAINNGACAVIFDPAGNGRQLAEAFRCDSSTLVPMIAVENLGLKLGELAARFYGDPSQFMTVIGITGTNGKTSCSQFLSQMLDDCGIIGTLGWGEWGKLNKTLNTTPDALAIQKILAELLKDKKRTVAMEVSSHGLEQGRVNGVTFKGAVFTNISRDHLDYHGTMDAYVQAKLALLNKSGLAFAAVNLDDDYSERIIAAVPESVQLWQFSVKGKIADSGERVSAENIRHKTDGIEFDVRFRDELQRVQVPLFGDFNVENVLAVLTVMLAMEVSLQEAVKKLAGIKPVDGRMERFGAETDPMIFVDYAHTPDALDKVLSSLRKHCKQALWVVFGCGGNRDTGKRPQMGKIAEQWADHVVITDDNPRYENGLDIVNDILAGCRSTAKDGASIATGMEPVRPAKVEVIQNREQAIQKVVASAAKNDCIVIAGKGHEQYQESNGVCVPFSDRQVVIDALDRRKALGNCSCIHAVEGER
ncbi:UDP-N-acetylmuramoyl-L-alanyl-D-glutamate--2,6-diaminopimelate ligase [Methylobacter sp.]|uniref:UDP-N-acetylmuramoyl-L-alanyl-D-glutamate--2, 6-diaminopimelate ligase n=1 Tax=Methylobacter sp. TaxID=2051955 RepID=UPI00248A7ABB|nr:UDP-N-acetylmuramoyl-L-alanyl-D-glutamate--2,6-diaminopimelate ligase [Methylobacter sp.]MDI1275879.1 UDP-N-acetylmuramoyl-L-alanyl-D-glutamate--2,6-diaminopimelate ligase [Methylobacter sp.]MDI1356621.1 UDP-N-acetylmuramoyl-L-alanyl-D-glutamate--2,6-diaminopimelate ligase [Methylobacter sp.]